MLKCNLFVLFIAEELKIQIKKALVNRFGCNNDFYQNTTFEFKTDKEGESACHIVCSCKDSIKISYNKKWSLGNFYRHITQKHPQDKSVPDPQSSVKILSNFLIRKADNMPETISEEAPHASSSAGSVNSEPVDAVKTTGDKHTIGASNEYASETMKMIQHTEEHHETDGSDCSGFAIEDEIEEDEPLVEVQSKLLKRKLKLQKKGN